MKRIEIASSHLGDSDDSDVIQAKRDVAETRKRAEKLIKKLDYFIGKAVMVKI